MRYLCDGTVLNLHCGDGYVNINVLENYIELNMYVYACKTCEIKISSVDCININFLVVILYYSCAEKCQRGNWVKGVTAFFNVIVLLLQVNLQLT